MERHGLCNYENKLMTGGRYLGVSALMIFTLRPTHGAYAGIKGRSLML